MHFELERVQRIVNDLKEMVYTKKISIKEYLVKEEKYTGECTVPTQGLTKFSVGELWGGYEKNQWFIAEITLTEKYENCCIIARVTTGKEGEWDALNPQGLFYKNGQLIQGIDVNHREVVLTQKGIVGEKIQIAMLMYSGLNHGKFILETDVFSLEKKVEKIYYDMLVPLNIAKLLEDGTVEKIRILKVLSEAVDCLDFRDKYSDDFYRSIEQAEKILVESFYKNIAETLPTVTAIGHTHIDIAWLWTVSQTKEKVVRSFATVLELMEQYPEYKFMSSQPILYSFIKDQEPKMFEKIKQRVKEGRWEVDGAMWLEADCNIPNGESFIRQILKGYKFFNEEFGVKSTCLWLPDVFGYSAALPQILKKSGIDSFMTTKISWNQFNVIPNDTFNWEGIDGSEVFAYFVTTSDYNSKFGAKSEFFHNKNTTTYTGILEPNQVMGTFDKYKNKDINEDTLMLFGYGDGGGGPTKEMLENGRRLAYGINGCPKVEIGFGGKFIDNLRKKLTNENTPKWVGELYLEYHRGTYTSMAKNKRYNRKSEILYMTLETIGAMGKANNHSYQTELIEKGWDTILLNQFHDIIPGSSIKKVYTESWEEYEEILFEGKKLLEENLSNLSNDIKIDEDSIVVYNPLSFLRTDIVSCQGKTPHKNIKSLINQKGDIIPIQQNKDGFKFFAEDIPSIGYSVFKISDEVIVSENSAKIIQLDDGLLVLNDFYEIKFDNAFAITSLFDKTNNRQIISPYEKGNEIIAFEDRPMHWENWDLDIYYSKKPYPVENVISWEVVENGQVYSCIRFKKKFIKSTIIQYIYIYNNIARIDFKNEIDWHEKNTVLKVYFPIDVAASKATFDIQYGNYERPTHSNTSWDVARFETCAHKWIDVSEGDYGVSLINDCKYGFDVKASTLGMTILKSGTYPNEDADIGEHEFVYSIYPHNKDVRNSDTAKVAYNVNVPMEASFACKNNGTMSAELSFLKIDKDNCIIEVVKEAEDKQGLIIRLYEFQNKRTDFTVEFFKDFEKVFECDLMENNINTIDFRGNKFTQIIKPFEIKTYRIICGM